jgi:hypothetical protein
MLHDIGCGASQDVVIAVDGTPVSQVLDRVFTRCRPPALIAIQREDAPQGFAFMLLRAATSKPQASEAAHPHPVTEQTSIGMLYEGVLALAGGVYEIDMGERRMYQIEPVVPRRALADA